MRDGDNLFMETKYFIVKTQKTEKENNEQK